MNFLKLLPSKRFEREFERARNANAKVYMLIENATWEKSIHRTLSLSYASYGSCSVNAGMVSAI